VPTAGAGGETIPVERGGEAIVTSVAVICVGVFVPVCTTLGTVPAVPVWPGVGPGFVADGKVAPVAEDPEKVEMPKVEGTWVLTGAPDAAVGPVDATVGVGVTVLGMVGVWVVSEVDG